MIFFLALFLSIALGIEHARLRARTPHMTPLASMVTHRNGCRLRADHLFVRHSVGLERREEIRPEAWVQETLP